MFFRKSVVIDWAFSYLVILLIPVITIFINYYNNVGVVKNEIVRVNEEVLENISVCVDEILEDEISFYSALYGNSIFRNMKSRKEMDAQFLYDAGCLKKQLVNYSAYNRNLFCCVYFVDKNYLIDVVGGGQSSYYYDSVQYSKPISQTYEEWKQIMTSYYNNEFVLNNIMNRNTNENCIIYAESLGYQEDERINVFVSIPVAEIASLVTGSNYKFLLTINEEDVLYIDGGQIKSLPEDIRYLEEREIMVDGEKNIFLQKKSAIGSVQYKLLIPEEEFWKEVQHTRNTLLISLAITLILGAVCVTYLLRRNLQPLSRLISKIGGEREDGNEYAQIEKVYNSLIVDNRFMQKQIVDQNAFIRKNELLLLLKGRNNQRLSKEDVINLKQGERLGMVGFEVPVTEWEMYSQEELMHFVIDNIFSELMETESFEKIEDGQNIFYLFEIPQERIGCWKQQCMEKVEYLCNFVEDKCAGSINAVVCDILGEKIEEISFLYQSILNAFEYQNMTGGKGVIDIESMQENSISENVSIALEMALKKENMDMMLETAEKIFRDAENISLQMYQMYALEELRLLVDTFEDYESDERKIRQLFEYIKPLLDASDKSAVNDMLKELLIYVYQTMHTQKPEIERGIVVKIKEYVKENYMDSVLNINTIANALERNPKYISRVFRAETQEGILDYINAVRIEEAINLLRLGSCSVEEVGEKVGYASCKTFRRAFLKKVGVTPGKYKID